MECCLFLFVAWQRIFNHTSVCSVFTLEELVSKMTRFHFLMEYFSSLLLWHQLRVWNSLFMLLYRGSESVTWPKSGKVAWKTTRWVTRRRKGRLVRLSILLSCVSFDLPRTLLCSTDNSHQLCVEQISRLCLGGCVYDLFFCLVSSQSQPVSWAPLSLVPWAHLSSTATTCQWSTHLQWWVLAGVHSLPLKWKKKSPGCFQWNPYTNRQNQKDAPSVCFEKTSMSKHARGPCCVKAA